MVSDISEPFREEHGDNEVRHEQAGQDESGHVVDAHRRSTPFTRSAVTAKRARVRATKARSAMRTPIIRWPLGHAWVQSRAGQARGVCS